MLSINAGKTPAFIFIDYYMRCLIVLNILFLSFSSLSQERYKAVYDCYISYNIEKYEDELKKYDAYNLQPSTISYNFIDSSVIKPDDIIPDSSIKNYFLELRKLAANSIVYTFYCAPLLSKRIVNSRKNETFIKSNSTFSITHNEASKSYSYSVLDISNMILLKYQYNTDTSITNCYKVDTTLPQFLPSGKKKKINNWHCKEYISTSINNPISVWVSDKIPNYVNPQVIIDQLQGGIVSIEFPNKSSITLRNLSISNTTIEGIDCTTISDIAYDLFDFYIRGL